MNSTSLMTVCISILIFCTWQSWTMFQSWIVSPYDIYNWLPFIIWLAPLAWGKKPESWVLPEIALFLAIIGIVTAINTFKYFALAFAIATWIPWTWTILIWIAASLSWMPGISWLTVQYPFAWVLTGRIMIAAISSIIVIRSLNREK